MFKRKRLSTPDNSQSPTTEIKKDKKQKKIKEEYIEEKTTEDVIVQQSPELKVKIYFSLEMYKFLM